jgi:outer membrane protein assembly factor BamB
MRVIVLAAAAAAGLAVLVDAAGPASAQTPTSGHWPQWRGPQRDGISPDKGLLDAWPTGGPPKLLTVSGIGAGFSSVSIAQGRIFTMGDLANGQHVFAIDEAKGQRLWATPVGGRHQDEYSGPRGTPTISGDLVYALGTDGDLVCLEAATGRVRWRRSLPSDFGGRMMSGWMYSESPLVDGDRVIVTPGGGQAGMVALDRLTGKEIWRAAIPRLGSAGSDGAGYSSIVVSNGGGVKQYVQLMGRGVIGVRASDGAFLWGYNRVANNIANITTPIVRGSQVFASSSYGTGSVLLTLTAAPGSRVEAKENYFLDGGTLQNHHGGFVLLNGFLYGGHGQSNGLPVCLELDTGRMMWTRTRGAGSGSAAVTAADGLLYFRYQNGTMALIEANPKQYTLKSSFDIPNVRNPSWSHPVVTGGRLYLREQDDLHIYNVRR